MAQLGLFFSIFVLLFVAAALAAHEAPGSRVELVGMQASHETASLLALQRAKRQGPWKREERERWEGERRRLNGLIEVERDAVRLAELRRELELLTGYGSYYGWGRR